MLEHLNATPEKPSRVVVMGAGGFVGGACVARLAAEGVEVLGMTRRDVDLLAPDAAATLAAKLRPDDVLIAVSALAPVKTVPMFVDNMVMVGAMCAALERTPVAHVVNISSDAVYADSPAPLTEDSVKAPDNLHGQMHVSRELLFREAVKGPLVSLRPTLIYGAEDPHNGYGPNRFRRLAAKGEAITLFGEGEERRDHVLVEDVAEIVARCVLHRSVGALTVATGEVVSFRELAEVVVAQFDRPVPVQGSVRNGPMPHDGYRPFDISACRAAFPEFSYTLPRDGIARVHRQAIQSA